VKRTLLLPLLLLLACADADVRDGSTHEARPSEHGRAAPATVIVHYPTGWGHRISLRGDGAGLRWTGGRDARWSEGDAWVVTLELDRAVELKPLYDDAVWSKGPNFRVEPGATLEIWPAFFNDRGRLERRADWSSPLLDEDRDVVVYLPPSYDENWRARYPVVYMHDGQNLWDDASAFLGVSWDVAGALDRGFADATIREAIVVGIDNTRDRIWEYTPTRGGGGGGAATYVGFIADELKPIVDRDYRTRPGRAHTGVVGSSLGGLVSVYAGLARHETFGLVGAVSPSTWWDGRWIIGEVRAAPVLPARVYVDSGDAGPSRDDQANTAELAAAFRERGAVLQYVLQPGASHNEQWWRQRLPGALAFLLGPR
jgi:predicted alpha/beta superfamily hydrolase